MVESVQMETVAKSRRVILHSQLECLIPVWIQSLFDCRCSESLATIDGNYREGVRELELFRDCSK